MTDEELFLELAQRLRVVHARISALVLPQAEKASILKRFHAITDASKHDVARAAKRLDALVKELDERPASS